MKKLKLFLLIPFILLILSGCGSELSENFNLGMNKKKTNVIYLMGYNFENSNPLLVKNEVNREIFSLIYDGLYKLNDRYSPVPALAESETVSPDGLTWKIKLNTNIFFHDGTTLSSNDVASTVRYLINNSTYYDYNVRDIENISTSGKDSVIIKLKKPAQNFRALLTFPIVNSKDLLAEFTFNGTGMFEIDNYVKRKYIILKPNDTYYGVKNDEISSIKVNLMPDKETANYSYSSGLSDIFSQDIFTEADSVNPKTDSDVVEFVSLDYTFLALNHDNKIFSDINVRRAINMAINKESIVEDVLFSHGEIVNTPITGGSDLAIEGEINAFNIHEAERLLDKAGYIPDVNTGIRKKKTDDEEISLSFEILVNNDNNFRIQVANLISDNLKYIGIDASVRIMGYDEYKLEFDLKTYQALIGTMSMSPDFDLTVFMGENNIGNYFSSSAVKTLRDISLTQDYEKKKSHYRELQKIFYESIPHVSLYYTKINLQHSPKIAEGLNPTGFNIYNNIEKWSF